MDNIFLEHIRIVNFKGVRDKSITFNEFITELCGANATCKTTVFDAFWWLLFDKNSAGESKFSVRTVDESGNPIHNTEISVTAKLNKNGEAIELCKTQKENWVKKRGETTAELKGSNNSFMINGVPKKAGEFAEFIAGIIKEEDFRFLTNVSYFNSLKTDDKRKYLLRLADDISDEQLLSENPEKWSIIRDDILSIGEEDAKAKAKKTLQLLTARQKELPVRIDELSRQIQTVPDVSQYDVRLNDLTAKAADLRSERDNMVPDTSLLESRIKAIDVELVSLRADHKRIIGAGRMGLVDKRNGIERELSSIKHELSSIKDSIQFDTRSQKSYQEKIKELSAKYKEAKERTFDETSKYCKSCGQILPAGKVELLTMNFENQKKADMKSISEMGSAIKAKIDSLTFAIREANEKVDKLSKTQESLEESLVDTESKISEYDGKALKFEDTEEYVTLMAERHERQMGIEDAKKAVESVQPINEELARIEREIAEIHAEQANIAAIRTQNENINSRISELESEQVETGQQIAHAEQKIILLEEYSVMKSNRLTESVNKKFELARFELFERQINGGIRPICETSYGGVRYGSLNTGHRITVGLDVIKTFQKLFGIKAPIFIDNAECLSSDNQPHMDCQLIMLKVTDDPELRVVA